MATQSPPSAPSDPFAFQMPQGSDGSWAQKLYQTHLGSSYFQKPKRPTDAFVVCHFAGKVGEAVVVTALAGGARRWLCTNGPSLELVVAAPVASQTGQLDPAGSAGGKRWAATL